LRFASVYNSEAGRKIPAIVALVEHVETGPVAIHAIALNPFDATVRVSLKIRKWSRGPVKGGAVRLAPAGPILAIGEGIEDSLAFMQEHRLPAWAAISETGIRNLVPPPLETTQTIILLEDQDPNQAGQ
jgi:hypothetical protein